MIFISTVPYEERKKEGLKRVTLLMSLPTILQYSNLAGVKATHKDTSSPKNYNIKNSKIIIND